MSRERAAGLSKFPTGIDGRLKKDNGQVTSFPKIVGEPLDKTEVGVFVGIFVHISGINFTRQDDDLLLSVLGVIDGLHP